MIKKPVLASVVLGVAIACWYGFTRRTGRVRAPVLGAVPTAIDDRPRSIPGTSAAQEMARLAVGADDEAEVASSKEAGVPSLAGQDQGLDPNDASRSRYENMVEAVHKLIRDRHEYEVMTPAELRAEDSRLAIAHHELCSPFLVEKFALGLGLYLGPSPEQAPLPKDLAGKPYATSQTAGVDGVYLATLEREEFPDLYVLQDTLAIIRSILHEKEHH